jgi:hypothetical protein
MKRRYILYRRKRGGMFYIEDTETRKQESTGTRNRAEATSLLNARNESIRQPHLNLQIAKAYLAGTDSGVSTRTWQQALDAIVETKSGSTQDRWRRAAKETALDSIRNRVILETQAEHLFACLKAGTVSTNVHLRKLHNFCLSMNWLPWPLIPKRLWPEVRFKERRAITSEEHQLIIEREKNPERRSFYELCWHRHVNGGQEFKFIGLFKAEAFKPCRSTGIPRGEIVFGLGNVPSGHEAGIRPVVVFSNVVILQRDSFRPFVFCAGIVWPGGFFQEPHCLALRAAVQQIGKFYAPFSGKRPLLRAELAMSLRSRVAHSHRDLRSNLPLRRGISD